MVVGVRPLRVVFTALALGLVVLQLLGVSSVVASGGQQGHNLGPPAKPHQPTHSRWHSGTPHLKGKCPFAAVRLGECS